MINFFKLKLINILASLKTYLKNHNGITLLEVVISMALLMLGTMGLIGIMATSKKQLYLSLDKEYLSLETQNIFENISFYEELKSLEHFNLNECEPLKNQENKIILNRANICKRLKNNLGTSNSSQSRDITLNATDLNGKKAKIKITNNHDNKTYIYSKMFAVK